MRLVQLFLKEEEFKPCNGFLYGLKGIFQCVSKREALVNTL